MRIAFFLAEFPAVSETFILNQITGMIDRGHDVTILASRPSNAGPVHADVERYGLIERTVYRATLDASRLRRLRLAGKLLLDGGLGGLPLQLRALDVLRFGRTATSLKLLTSTFPHLQRRDFDVIHCHYGPLGLLAVQLRDIGALSGPIATTFHGFDLTRWLVTHGAEAYRPLLEAGDLFLPISQHWRCALVEMGARPERTIVHHMGVDTRRLRFRERRPDPDGVLRLATACRLVEKKGIDDAIEAVATARAAGVRVEYTIIGDGPLRSRLADRIRALRCEAAVRLEGWKDQTDVAAVFERSHALLLPSVTAADGDSEGIPVAIMEALAHGMPVISTRHSGIPELVQDGISGLLAEERSPAELASRIVELAGAPERWASMGRAGREFVEAHFDIRRLNDDLLELFANLRRQVNTAEVE